MASAMNKDWATDRFEVVENLNRYRLLLFTEYEKFQLFTETFHRICVTQFNGYQGFTLPEDVLAPEAVWSYGQPLTLRSRWREAHVGLGLHCGGRVEAILMAEMFATERDLKSTTKIKIYPENSDDAGKKVYVEVIDASDRPKRIEFILVANGFAVSPVKVRQILSVSIPVGLKGSLLLTQLDNYELSRYSPWETAPSYQRMKVTSSNCPSTILLQGTKRFKKVYFDHDIVEVGNQLIIEEAAYYFKFGGNTSEPNEIKVSEMHRQKMENFLKSEIARHRGNAQQDNSLYNGTPRRPLRQQLPGYRR